MKDVAIEESIEASAIDKSHARAIRRGKESIWLTRRGYDGLWCQGECACKVDDLYPCGERQDCHPGYVTPCPPDCGEHDWHIGSAAIRDARSAAPSAPSQPLEPKA